MHNEHPIVDNCSERQPSVHLLDQLQQTFGIVLCNEKNFIQMLLNSFMQSPNPRRCRKILNDNKKNVQIEFDFDSQTGRAMNSL